MGNKSKKYTLSLHDIGKGFIMAVLGMLASLLGIAINSNTFPTDWIQWKTILLASLGAGLLYLTKNFFTNSKDRFLGKEPKH